MSLSAAVVVITADRTVGIKHIQYTNHHCNPTHSIHQLSIERQSIIIVIIIAIIIVIRIVIRIEIEPK